MFSIRHKKMMRKRQNTEQITALGLAGKPTGGGPVLKVGVVVCVSLSEK